MSAFDADFCARWQVTLFTVYRQADGFSFCGQHLGLSAGSARSSYSAIDEVQNNGEKAKSSGHVAPARPDSATSKRENKKKSTKEKKSKGKSSNAKSASSSKATTKASRHSSRKETGINISYYLILYHNISYYLSVARSSTRRCRH
eukprot:SAG31_NODE_3889_length_3773_cov_10.825721_3_plen_146_part_00